jgi:hypothetical protein
MAKSRYNVVMHGSSGIVGDLLMFSQRFGKTYFGKIPVRNAAPTATQLAAREKFSKAVQYAKVALTNPEIKKLYEQRASGDTRAYNLAIADFFQAPAIREIITATYNGAVGSRLELYVTDDTAVSSVEVAITAPDGSLIEKGNALQEENSPKWLYAATAVNSSLAGSKITVTAKDLPGNVASEEKVL